MEQKKDVNINIKKSTLKTIKKYILVLVCCFIAAMAYPFINIYWGEIESVTISNKRNYSYSYGSSTNYYIKPLNGDRKEIENYFKYDWDYRYEKDKRFEIPSLSATLKLMFNIEVYTAIFYYTFFSLLIISLIVLNFRFKFKLKDE